jgi:sulfur-carrier protein
MAVTVIIPTPLRNLTQNLDTVEVQASNIGELVAVLETAYPGIGTRLISESGALHRFINFYVNDEDIRFLQDLDTPLKDGDQVSIVPAIAGGV